MAAATISAKKDLQNWPVLRRSFTMSAMTSDQQETVTHSGPKATPDSVTMNLTTRPTDGSTVSFQWLSTSVTNGTVTVRLWAEGGGSLDGAVADVYLTFRDHADQNQTSITVS